MSRIADAFQNKKAFVAYLMAGDPDLRTSGELLLAAQEAGADLIEIGIPFSDPIAEGEVIQAASVRALEAGADLEGIFCMVASIRDQMRIPMVFMTYVNPVFVYGYERFFARCEEIGICGIIIPDLPFEEQGEVKEVAARFQVEVVTLVAPTSKERVARIAKEAEGFLYQVSSLGVTGVRGNITADVPGMVREIRQYTDLPVAVGFGVGTPEQAGTFAAMADGVIVGSALVRLVAQYGMGAGVHLAALIQSMKSSMQ